MQQAGWEANIYYAASVASGPGVVTGLGVEWGWEGPYALVSFRKLHGTAGCPEVQDSLLACCMSETAIGARPA